MITHAGFTSNDGNHTFLTQAGYDALKSGLWRSMAQIDLSHIRVSNFDLVGINLENAILIKASLGGIRLMGANLIHADLSRAYMVGADLRGADLYYADLQGTNLQGSNLRGADFRGADFRGANLNNSCIIGADFTDAKYDAKIAHMITPEHINRVWQETRWM